MSLTTKLVSFTYKLFGVDFAKLAKKLEKHDSEWNNRERDRISKALSDANQQLEDAKLLTAKIKKLLDSKPKG